MLCNLSTGGRKSVGGLGGCVYSDLHWAAVFWVEETSGPSDLANMIDAED